MSMGSTPRAFSDYRNAFAEFARRARQARALMAAPAPDWQAIDAALLELEKARVNYNHRRDILAQELLNASQLPDLNEPHADRVRQIAELRWELAGKPEGTADENWYRAEEIVRLSDAA